MLWIDTQLIGPNLIRDSILSALGPAWGSFLPFLVSWQALHPAIHSTNDFEAFLKGIHVAMISTFLGLLI